MFEDGRIWLDRIGGFDVKRPGRYHIVGVSRETHWRVQRVKAAQLVLEAFVGPPPFRGAHSRHLNDEPDDDRAENLAWGGSRDNRRDAFLNRLRGEFGERLEGVVREVRIRAHRGERIPHLSQEFNVSSARLSRLVKDSTFFPHILCSADELAREACKRQSFDCSPRGFRYGERVEITLRLFCGQKANDIGRLFGVPGAWIAKENLGFRGAIRDAWWLLNRLLSCGVTHKEAFARLMALGRGDASLSSIGLPKPTAVERVRDADSAASWMRIAERDAGEDSRCA